MTERLSVIVPVYSNETTLRQLKDRLTTTLLEMAVDDFELIFVDDASPDGSWAVIEAMAVVDPKVRGLRLASNVGQPIAYCAGIDVAEGEALASIDADLEHPPEALARLVGALRDGHDLVVARRVGRTPPTIRRIGSRTINLLGRVVKSPVSDQGSAFLVCTAEVAAEIRHLITRTRRQMLLPQIFRDAARNPTTIDVEMSSSPTSGYTLRRVTGLFAEFLAAEMGPAIGRRTLLGSGLVILGCVHPRHRRASLALAASMAGLGIVGVVLPRAFRRDPTAPLYSVAAHVGRGLRS